MTTFESKININCSVNDIYRFLSDFNNHKELMPDNVQDWSSTFNEASFNIQNMVKLSLKIDERVDKKSIKIIAIGQPPFPVSLTWSLSPNGDSTNVTFTINADLNMMMKMMASGPLQKLADSQTNTLAKVLTA